MNVTFFTPRGLYNRKQNLALIVSVLRERWKLNVEASPRDDILLDGLFKISFKKKIVSLVFTNQGTGQCNRFPQLRQPTPDIQHYTVELPLLFFRNVLNALTTPGWVYRD